MPKPVAVSVLVLSRQFLHNLIVNWGRYHVFPVKITRMARLIVVLWENLLLVVVLVLKSKALLFCFSRQVQAESVGSKEPVKIQKADSVSLESGKTNAHSGTKTMTPASRSSPHPQSAMEIATSPKSLQVRMSLQRALMLIVTYRIISAKHC